MKQNGLFRGTVVERVPLIAAGLLLVYPASIADWMGFACAAVVLASQQLRKRAYARLAHRSRRALFQQAGFTVIPLRAGMQRKRHSFQRVPELDCLRRRVRGDQLIE